jgi:hypothetical protein
VSESANRVCFVTVNSVNSVNILYFFLLGFALCVIRKPHVILKMFSKQIVDRTSLMGHSHYSSFHFTVTTAHSHSSSFHFTVISWKISTPVPSIPRDMWNLYRSSPITVRVLVI